MNKLPYKKNVHATARLDKKHSPQKQYYKSLLQQGVVVLLYYRLFSKYTTENMNEANDTEAALTPKCTVIHMLSHT